MRSVGILSKGDLEKRFLVGEILIQKRISEDDLLKNDSIKKIEASLNELLLAFSHKQKNQKIKDDKEWRNYNKTILSETDSIIARRSAIEAIVIEYFLDKTITDIRTNIDPYLKDSGYLIDDKTGQYPLPFFIDDADFECFQGANYDLRLGENVYVTTERVPKRLSIEDKDVIAIEPGEFGILMTHEYIFVPPDLLGFISVRLTHKQKGLVNISGFHVDPGFYGRLMFSVFNAGPKDVPLRYKDRVFMIMFNELTNGNELKCPRSKWGGMTNIPVETLSGLAGSSVSVRSLDKRISRIELWIPIIVGLFSTLLAAVIGWLLTGGKS